MNEEYDDEEDFDEEDFDEEDEEYEEYEEYDGNPTDLEKEYIKTYKEIQPKIQAKLDKAQKALDEAVELADEYQIPFYAHISPLGQAYRPEGLSQRDIDLVNQEFDEYIGEYDGWQHSAVC